MNLQDHPARRVADDWLAVPQDFTVQVLPRPNVATPRPRPASGLRFSAAILAAPMAAFLLGSVATLFLHAA